MLRNRMVSPGDEPKVTFKQIARMMTEADWRIARQERLLAEHEDKQSA
ncbi:MAG: hypothetical protein IH624_03300 [Phycisphaerae bacterium]|nr:hypothetical protein [Phycisphaerae bacterium]